MADKQINMPLLPFPSWANDDDFVDPPEVWDGTATKVEPGNGKRDDGWLPEENPAAQHLNQLLNEVGKWVQYMSTIQPMNWFDSGLIGGGNETGESLVYDEGVASWIWGGRADTFTSSRDGQTFSGPFASGTAQTYEGAATKRPDDAPTHTGARSLFIPRGAATDIAVEFTGAFAAQVCPGSGLQQLDWCIWDRINQLWIIGGREDVAGTPATVFWTDATPISGFTNNTAGVAANSVEVIHMCHGEDGAGGALNVAVGDGVSPNFDVWTSTNGTTWVAATPSGITAGEDARSIMWCPKRSLFVLLTNDSCYTSTNGTAWSQVSTYPGGNEFQFRCVATDEGGLWVAAYDFIPGIVFSYDGGATWRFVPVPPAENGTDPIHNIFYSRAAGRFGITWVDNPPTPVNSANFAMSLAVGETPYLADGVTIQFPVVT
jgi:hypothetical protein